MNVHKDYRNEIISQQQVH